MNRVTKRVGIAAVMAALALEFGVAAAARAHEGHEHEMRGTVKANSAEKLELTATDGKDVEFLLTESTKFLRGAATVKREDVIVGERAIVKFLEKGETKQATEVKLGEKKP